jgi:hypothetical protein
MVSAVEVTFERKCSRAERVGEDLLLIVLGGELSVGKIGNRESNGALDFDVFCWMGGRNNQPKVGRNDGISFGEDNAQGDDDWGGHCRIVCAIRFRSKNKYNEIRRGYRRPPIDDCTQQPAKLTPAQWVGGGYERTRDRQGMQGVDI